MLLVDIVSVVRSPEPAKHGSVIECFWHSSLLLADRVEDKYRYTGHSMTLFANINT